MIQPATDDVTGGDDRDVQPRTPVTDRRGSPRTRSSCTQFSASPASRVKRAGRLPNAERYLGSRRALRLRLELAVA
jgi:hypothetical protein